MHHVRRSVIVDAPVALTIEVSNQIESWPQMMDDYVAAEVLSQEGAKMWFRLSHANGSSWTSWRVVHPEAGVAIAERHEPRAPFRFMQHAWIYRSLAPERTEMTWEQTFELPDAAADQETRVAEYLVTQTERNQKTMKNYIERTFQQRLTCSSVVTPSGSTAHE